MWYFHLQPKEERLLIMYIFRRFHFILILLLCSFTATTVYAQKQYKSIRTVLKAKNGAEAMRLVETCEKDSILQKNPQTYDYGTQAQIIINDAENVKAYLKQPYDTVKFFQSTCKIFEYILKCEQAELDLLEREGKKQKFMKENRQRLHQFYRNLGAGGRFFFAKGKYKEAQQLMTYYLDTPLKPIWGDDKSVTTQPAYVNTAFTYQRAAFLSGNFADVANYSDLTLADTSYRRNVIELLARSAEALGDTVLMAKRLIEGIKEYPHDTYFFTRLTDYFSANEDYNHALLLADSLLQIYPNQLLYMASRTVSLMNLQRYPEGIEAAKECLALDSTLIDMRFFIGAAYCKMASEISLPTNINSKTYRDKKLQMQELYNAARPYIEEYRSARPDKSDKWPPLLERIYWNLNLGLQYDEITKLMQKK